MRQLRDVDINRASADARLSAALRRRGDGVATPELADGAPGAPGAGDSSLKITPLPAADADHAARRRRSAPPEHAGKWDAALPLPPAYERLADVFVALQQVGPLLRKRQQACTADIVCASVETMTGRRCSLAMLRSVEAVQPGTVSFSVRGGGSAFDPASGPTSPRRVRADVADPDVSHFSKNDGDESSPLAQFPQKTQDAKGVSARRFRAALVALVGARHDAFCASEASKKGIGNSSPRAGPSSRGGESERVANDSRDDEDVAPVTVDGVVVEWHARFDLATVPDPPLVGNGEGAASRSGGDADRELGEASRGEHLARERIANGERRERPAPIVGNGSAVPDDWHRGHAKDTADAKARALGAVPVARAEAAAAAAALGDAGSELPLAAVAAVMKRKRMADHDRDPATVAERRRRRLCDLLPGTFDTVRSLFATSKKKVSPFADLLERTVRATAKKNASSDETEAALRLVAEASPEWCALMPAHTTVSGEELFRIKTSDAAVTRFVRQKLVAMKEDKL